MLEIEVRYIGKLYDTLPTWQGVIFLPAPMPKARTRFGHYEGTIFLKRHYMAQSDATGENQKTA